MIPEVKRLTQLCNMANLNTATAKVLATIWVIEGVPGFYTYHGGCNSEFVATKPDHVVAVQRNHEGLAVNYAVYSRLRDLETVVCQALGVQPPK